MNKQKKFYYQNDTIRFGVSSKDALIVGYTVYGELTIQIVLYVF